MTCTRSVCACLLVATGIAAGFWCGRLTAPQSLMMQSSSPPNAAPQNSPPKFSAVRLAEIRTDVVEQHRLAGETLAWLDGLPRTSTQNPNELPYDSLAVYHAIKFFGDVHYAPAVPFLIREAFERDPERRLRIANPHTQLLRADSMESSPIFDALIRIGPPSAEPLVDEYLRFWKLPPSQERDAYLGTIKYTLEEDALVGAALKHIHKRLVKANFADIDRDELDALQHLKRELLQPLE